MNTIKRMEIRFEPITRENWEAALKLQVHPNQEKYVPSVAVSLASAYVKPWDEALDPYLICINDELVGFFYISYTPDSRDNYWIGGFFIDKTHQRKGYGNVALLQIMTTLPELHPNCEIVHLTVEPDNEVAQKLYKSLGFKDTGKMNKYGEIVYKIPVNAIRVFEGEQRKNKSQ